MMAVDISAEVIRNTRLSDDYNVLALSAPAIAETSTPGQFVMVKAGRGHDPLLRRPFSVFEVLRDKNGRADGISLLNKRIGVSTRLLYEAEPGQRVACLGPLGRPFTIVDPPTEAWMVAGGVGLAPFAALGEALRGRGVRTTLFYGARRGAELFYLDLFRDLDIDLVSDDRGRQRRRARDESWDRWSVGSPPWTGAGRSCSTPADPRGCFARARSWRRDSDGPVRYRSSA